MTRARLSKNRNVWDRGEIEKAEKTDRSLYIQKIATKKLFTIDEAAIFLNVEHSVVRLLIKKGIIEVLNADGRKKFIHGESLRRTIKPVQSLNKRLQLLAELQEEVNAKIDKLKKQIEHYG